MRGENVDEVENWLELQAGEYGNPNETLWDQVRDGWLSTGSSKLRVWDVEETVQGFPHSLEEGVEYDKSRIVAGKNVDVEKNSQSNKQELVYCAEAVANRLSK